MAFISGSGTGFAAPTRGSATSIAKGAAAIGLFAILGATSPGAQLEVNVEHLRSNDGLIHVCVTRNEDHFPDCAGDPAAVKGSFRAAETRSINFRNLPSGGYAVAILHDENGNNRMDTFAGIPREGIGFSRNPRFSFGPPRFSAARFALNGTGGSQSIRLRYFM